MVLVADPFLMLVNNPKLVADPFLMLVNNPKQPWHARNSFENKMF